MFIPHFLLIKALKIKQSQGNVFQTLCTFHCLKQLSKIHCEWEKIGKVIIKKQAKVCTNSARLAQTFIPHFILIKSVKNKTESR